MRSQMRAILEKAPISGRVLDVGCFGFAVKRDGDSLGRTDLQHAGIDYSPVEPPQNFEYRICDLNKDQFPFPDDTFDVVVASHVIEHMQDPVAFFRELARVTKCGGKIFIEAPSEQSALRRGMWFAFDEMRSLSFWDDPTHLGRPWPPQALYRLASCYSCEVEKVGYQTTIIDKIKALIKIPLGTVLRNARWVETGIWSLYGWAAFAVIRKPYTGKVQFHYAGRDSA